MFRFVLLLFAVLLIPSFTLAQSKQNVIIMLIDDLGYYDLGCHGNRLVKTPHIDQLAKDGVRFTTAFSACTVCSPTRAALLTGQYPARLHITDWIPGHGKPDAKLMPPKWTQHLPTESVTLAKLFKAAGYATASIGKWHLGGQDYYPEKHGFDVNIGGTEKGQPGKYFPPFGIATLKDGSKDEFLSDRLTNEACEWITSQKEQPFFIYFPHYAVHTPLAGKPDVIAKYRAQIQRMSSEPPMSAVYAALVESVDDSVGKLRENLRKLKLDEKTVFIFTSDNGGLLGNNNNRITTIPQFRAGKGSAYEGGVRVPFIVHWPGVTPKSAQPEPCDRPVITMDIFSTLVDGCGLKVPTEWKVDGQSLIDSLKIHQAPYPSRDLYWHYPHYHPGGATPYSAIRSNDGWRLIEFYEDGRLELYNTAQHGEKVDESRKNPAKVQELMGKLRVWRDKTGAQPPVLNPRNN